MGMECYLLFLKGNDSTDVESDLRSLRHMEPDSSYKTGSRGERYYVFRDGEHVVELEVLPASNGTATKVSMRFANCHPDSVGRVFVEIAAGLMTRQNLSATICEDLPSGTQMDYSPHEVDAFRVWCLWSIENARQQWQLQFGPERMGVSVGRACQHFFFDRFQNPGQ